MPPSLLGLFMGIRKLKIARDGCSVALASLPSFCLVQEQKRGGSFLFLGIMGSSDSRDTNEPKDSKQLQFPRCWKHREFEPRAFMTPALTAPLFSHSSANHWRFLRLPIHAQDHLSCHHHHFIHCEGAGWHSHCWRRRSKGGEGPVWGQS